MSNGFLGQIKPFSIVTGHYGSGKTNFSLNLAVMLAACGKRVTIVDLDIVNPYFRTAEYRTLLEGHNIRVIAPNFAGTNLDTPSLPPEVDSIFAGEQDYVILDVGGDDAGAVALGRYASRLLHTEHELYYVFNACRYLTQSAEQAAEFLKQIEYASRMKATAVINNSNLGEETTSETVQAALAAAQELAGISGLPLTCTAVMRSLHQDFPNCFPVEIYVNPNWE